MAARQDPAREARVGMAVPGKTGRTVLVLTLATATSFAAWLASGSSPRAHLPLLAALLWLGALLLLLMEGKRDWRPAVVRSPILWAVAGICALAFVLRIFSLSRIPAILTGNEADFGLSAVTYLRGEHTNLFDTDGRSFPAMYSLVESWALRFFGATTFGLRLPSVLIGTLAVAATFIYASRGFGKTVGLASAFFLAASGFHVHFSRLGLNNIWESLFSALLALTLAIAWESEDRFRFILPGLVLGLMQFFYLGSRLFLILMPLWVLFAASAEVRPRQERIGRIGIALWAAAVVVLPLALFYLQHPGEFFAPWRRVSLFWYWWDVQTVAYGDPWWWVLGDQLIKAPLGFVSASLTEFYNGPLLTPMAAVFFLVGCFRVVRGRRAPYMLWIGLWLAGTVATVSLSANPPAAQRYIGAAPAVAVVVALGVEELVRLVATARATTYRFRVSLLIGLLVVAAAWELRHYFIAPSAAQAFSDLHVGTAARAAEALAEEEQGHAAFFFVVPGMRLAQDASVLFLAPAVTALDVPDTEDWQVSFEASREYSLFFLPGREDDLAAVRGCLPQGEISQAEGWDDRLLFQLYMVDPDQSVVCGAQPLGTAPGGASGTPGLSG